MVRVNRSGRQEGSPQGKGWGALNKDGIKKPEEGPSGLRSGARAEGVVGGGTCSLPLREGSCWKLPASNP